MSNFLNDVAAEVARARIKFPSSRAVSIALMEEVGEVAKALLDEPWTNVYNECVQVAAMALRLAEEKDSTLTELRRERNLRE